MKQALGLVEIAGLCIAVAAADAMVKAANVELVELEPAKGGGYMTIKVVGDVGAVNAAAMVGRQVGEEHGKLVAWKVIPRPSDFVEDAFVKREEKTEGEKGEENIPEAEENTPETGEVKAEESISEAEEAKAEENASEAEENAPEAEENTPEAEDSKPKKPSRRSPRKK